MIDDRDDDDGDLGLRDWAVPPPPAGLVDQIVARVDGTGVHPMAAREPVGATSARSRGRIAMIGAVLLVAAGALLWIAVPRGGGSTPPAAIPPGQLTAAADSVITLAPGTVAEVAAGGELAWRIDERGALHVTQSAGAITYQHDGGRRLTVDAAFARVDAERTTIRVEVPMTRQQRRIAAGAVGAAVATAVVVACYRGDAEVSNAHGQVKVGAGSSVAVHPDRAPARPSDGEAVARTVPTSPRKLPSAAARAEVLDELAKARARREIRDKVSALNSAAGVPDMEPEEIQTAVREVAPMLAECFEMAPRALQEQGGNLVAELTVVGEPEVGTVFEDATFADGTPAMLADADFSECVRETLLSVEMPPLLAGGKVVIRYPFVFALGEPDEEDEPDPTPKPERKRPNVKPEPEAEPEAKPEPEPEASTPTASLKELIDQANDAARTGQYGKALTLAERALAIDSDNQQALTAAAIASCNLKDRDRAIGYLAKLSGQRAGMIRQVCKRNGVQIPEP